MIFNPQKIDMHMHSTVSDGSDTPLEILNHVRELGLELFSLTDHDAIKGSILIESYLKEDDPKFLCGIEFSCKDEGGQYHILGYGYDPQCSAMTEVVELGHNYRMRKVHDRLDFLREEFGFTFSKEDLDQLLSLDNPGKPHIGLLMTKYGYSSSKEDAINNYINKVHFQSEYVRPEQAIEGILKSGGIPVLAHPSYGSGSQLIVGEDMRKRLEHLIAYGLQGVEAFYSGFTKKLETEMLNFAEEYHLYISAGSDYHGKNKLVVLGDTNIKKEGEYPEGLCRFLKDIEKYV